MERVLIVSSSANGREFLRELLRGQEYGQVVFADNGGAIHGGGRLQPGGYQRAPAG